MLRTVASGPAHPDTSSPANPIVSMPCAMTLPRPDSIANGRSWWMRLKSPEAPAYITSCNGGDRALVNENVEPGVNRGGADMVTPSREVAGRAVTGRDLAQQRLRSSTAPARHRGWKRIRSAG